jgi:hypothetical protein
MGHSSTRAAQVYLHARQERDHELASTLDKMAKRELRKAKKPPKQPEKPTGTEAEERPLTREAPASGT